jgi:thiamine-phosphate pyrophosphorylase
MTMPQNLAEVARRLNRLNAKGQRFPSLFLMTDTKRLPDPSSVIVKLPKGSAVIIRHETRQGKINLIHKIKELCRKHQVKLLVSDDIRLCLAHRLDGVHLSQKKLLLTASCGYFIKAKPQLIITSACHSLTALKAAEKSKIDGVLISPVFATDSHPNAKTLGLWGFQNLTKQIPLKCYGLGGINKKTAQRLQNSKACGLAAINGLI